jgi:hypothetical protein
MSGSAIYREEAEMVTGITGVRKLLVGGATLLAVGIWLVTPPVTGTAMGGPANRQSHDDIFIQGDHEFNPAHGIERGRGTKAHPFVIAGYDIGTVYIKDTGAHLVVRNNTIENLYLNWNGGHVKVLDNDIGDLRVNENIERTGDPTSGRIAHNTFDVVGQLRHWDGIFEDNVVGSPQGMTLPFFSNEAVNFDGFNGSHFRDNTIYGYVDVRLHGHHHGSNFHGPSHYHGATEEGEHHHGDGKMVDHTKRYHRVTVSNNRIYAAGPWALRYVDDNHAGNDRTAASETNPALNEPHMHFTHVTFKNNKLFGSGLYVDIFNADDEEVHKKIGHGMVSLVGNRIALDHELSEPFSSEFGIRVERAQHLMLHIAHNKVGWLDDIERPDEQFLSDVGISLYDIDVGKVHIFDNELTNFEYGIQAGQLSKTVHWWVGKLKTKKVNQRIYYDDSVANRPQRGR